MHPTRTLRAFFALFFAGILVACGGSGGGASPVAAEVPTLMIRSDVTGEVRTTFNVQFFFSGPVSFPSGTLPFSLSGASAVSGSFKQLSSDSYQISLVPNSNSQGLIDLRVPPGAYAGASGTGVNVVAYEFAQPFYTLAPFAQLKFNGPVDILGFITGSGSVTLTFNSVLDATLTVDKLNVSAGSVSNFSKTSAAGENDVYSFVFTPPASTSGGVTFELKKAAVTSSGIGNDRNWWTFGLATP